MVGTDHTIAPLALRERLALDAGKTAELLQTLRTQAAIDEAVVLSTCNRAEIYIASTDPRPAIAAVRRRFASLVGQEQEVMQALVVREGVDAVRHLCAVASGLESRVVAEGQILGQVRGAIDQARRLDAAGPHLSAVFRAAVACGKRVRTETAIGQADISAGSVLLEVIGDRGIAWPAQQVLLIGAGRMNGVTAGQLSRLGVREIVVASRTMEAASALAAAVGGRAIPLGDVAAAARDATLVISATRSPGLMLTAEMLGDRADRPMIVADLAVPRDVDPAVARLPGITLIDIDHLDDLRHRQGLPEALSAAAAMVEQAAAEWQAWCRARETVPMITGLRNHLETQRDAELARTLAQLGHLPPEDRAVIAELANRLVNKMFHHLAVRMKTAAADPTLGEQYLEAVRVLFPRETHSRECPAPDAAHLTGETETTATP